MRVPFYLICDFELNVEVYKERRKPIISVGDVKATVELTEDRLNIIESLCSWIGHEDAL